VLTSGNV